jgi:hypothetical protein
MPPWGDEQERAGERGCDRGVKKHPGGSLAADRRDPITATGGWAARAFGRVLNTWVRVVAISLTDLAAAEAGVDRATETTRITAGHPVLQIEHIPADPCPIG